MTATQTTGPRFWTGPRLFALAVASLVAALFIGANAHLIVVSFASRPDCVLQPPTTGAVVHRPAKSSC